MNSQLCKDVLTVAVLAAFVSFVVAFELVRDARARDLGQWENSDPVVKQWYQTLMQPDNPQVSCCGEADAYFADKFFVKDGKTYAVITDDRPDGPLGRPHRDLGEIFEVPNHKLKWDRANPTGHNIIFMSRVGYVYCFVQGTGI